MPANSNKREALYHMALLESINKGHIPKISNEDFKNLFCKYANNKLQHIWESIYPLSNFNTFKKELLEINPNFSKVISKLANPDLGFEMHYDILDNFPILYSQGNINLLKEQSIAVIGGLEKEVNGEIADETARVVAGFAKDGYTILGGLSEGYETIAHKTALKYGHTVAVIGNPLDCYSPKKNKDLQIKISKDGLVISKIIPAYFELFNENSIPKTFGIRFRTMFKLTSSGIFFPDPKHLGHAGEKIKDSALNSNLDIYLLNKFYTSDINWINAHKERINFL